MGRYDLPEEKVRSKVYLILPTVALVSVLLGLFFGTVAALAWAINDICSLVS